MPIQQLCPILRVQRLNPYAYSILLSAGPLAKEALPGQFVHVRCGEENLLRRPISICSVEGDTLRLVFEVRGAGTLWLSQRREGESLDLLGPLGRGFDVAGKKLLLLGGGVGTPPLLYVAQAAKGECHAFLGFRDKDHVMLMDEFQQVARSVAVSTDDGSLGCRGFAHLQAEKLLEREGAFSALLACGPKPMLRAAAELARRYHLPCQVSMEERMGCGVGACLVCACQTTDGQYRHVCKDGPVFDAREVDWDAE